MDAGQGGAELRAPPRHELPLEPVQLFELREVGDGGLFRLPLCRHVLERGQEVVDRAVLLADRREAPVDPELGAVRPSAVAVRLARLFPRPLPPPSRTATTPP